MYNNDYLTQFKDKYKMNVINSYRFVKDEPIMSFQTDKNGTFNPSFTGLTGTLRWVVDGSEQITNTPSYSLTGSTVDVKVYSNDVIENETTTNVGFSSQNIIGTLNFSYFTIDGVISTSTNSGLTSIVFGTQNNYGTIIDFKSCNLSSLDLSSFTINGNLALTANTNLSSILFKNTAHTCSNLEMQTCSFSTLDFSNFTFSGAFQLNGNSVLTSINLGTNNHSFTTFRVDSCNLNSLDLSNVSSINGLFFFLSNSNLSSITFGSGTYTSSWIWGSGCNLTTLDLSGWNLSGQIQLYSNNLSTLTFPVGSITLSKLELYSNNFTSLNLSNIICTSIINVSSNTNLTSITHASYTTGLSQYNVSNCALDLTTVDSLFSGLNTFFTANTPIKDLSVPAAGGTNSSPTGGASNTDIVNLDTVVYPGAGFNFVYTIN